MTGAAMKLSALLRRAGIDSPPSGPDPTIRHVEIDSRRIGPGDLFVAVPGAKADGASFAHDAVLRGAAAVLGATPRPDDVARDVAWVEIDDPRRFAGPLAREAWGRPDEDLAVVGITGTNGKTTVVHLLESITAAAGRPAGRIGTTGYAMAGDVLPAARTTPEGTELHRLLAGMRDAGVAVVAVEVSSHSVSLHRIAGLRFAVAAFLNLGRDHLDFHGDSAAYFEAKASLFDMLGPDRTAVLPADSPWGDRLRGRTRARVLRFGRTDEADVRLREEHCSADGSSAVLDTPSGSLPVRTLLLGRFNLDNVAAAATCAIALDLPADAITAGVLALRGVPGRLERIDSGQPFTLLVDYAHTPEALRRVLSSLRELSPARLTVVFGCGGERDVGKRHEMGRVAAGYADSIYLTNDNPRGESPEAILGEIARGVESAPGGADRYRVVPDRREAVLAAARDAGPGDIVVVAGKGHETTQTIGDREVPLDDREVASAALAALGWTREETRAGI